MLTDGTILLDAEGRESKRFSIRDGTALVWARQAGLLTGVLSARTAAATTERARQLGMAVVRQQAADKAVAFAEILAEQGLAAEDVAYMGDDLWTCRCCAWPVSRRRRPTRPTPSAPASTSSAGCPAGPAPCASSSRACCTPRTLGAHRRPLRRPRA